MYLIKRFIDERKGKEWVHARHGFDYIFPIGRLQPHSMQIRNNKHVIDCHAGKDYHLNSKEYDTAIIRRVADPGFVYTPAGPVFVPGPNDSCCSLLYFKDSKFVKGHNHDIWIEQMGGSSFALNLENIEEWIAYSLLHIDTNINEFLKPFTSKDFPSEHKRNIEKIVNHDSSNVFEIMLDFQKRRFYETVSKERLNEILHSKD